MKCPNCQKEFYNNDNPNSCPLCGYSFVENKAVENSHQDSVNQKQDASDKASDKKDNVAGNICENCGYVNNENETRCKRCGRTVTPTSQILKCPRCGNEFQGEYCHFCGYQTIQESNGNVSTGFNNANQNMENSVNSNQQNTNPNMNNSNMNNPKNVKNQFNKQVETPSNQASGKVECLRCHYLNENTVSYCQACGNHLNECPECGNYLEHGTCSVCGFYKDEYSLNRTLVKNTYKMERMDNINAQLTIVKVLIGSLIVLILLIWFYILIYGIPLGYFVGRG